VTLGKRHAGGAALIVAVSLVVLALAGCGTAATPSGSPPSTPPASAASPAPSGSDLTSQLAAIQTYYQEVTPVMSELRATVVSIPDALQGMSATPDGTWTTAADKLDAIATQLGDQADSLAAITPPDFLKSVHDLAVKGIRDAQPAVTRAADLLAKGAALGGKKDAKLQEQAAALGAQLSQLSQQLLGATEGL
jgi:hypothetical protein